jgi:hypothetical protein
MRMRKSAISILITQPLRKLGLRDKASRATARFST